MLKASRGESPCTLSNFNNCRYFKNRTRELDGRFLGLLAMLLAKVGQKIALLYSRDPSETVNSSQIDCKINGKAGQFACVFLFLHACIHHAPNWAFKLMHGLYSSVAKCPLRSVIYDLRKLKTVYSSNGNPSTTATPPKSIFLYNLNWTFLKNQPIIINDKSIKIMTIYLWTNNMYHFCINCKN